jgi:tRNA 2-selenouridine synthase
MFIELPYEKLMNNSIFIDVRSESEYEDSHIPGAVNIPLFNNEERKIIGTAYKQDSVDEARRLGVKFASEKMPEIFEKLIKLRGDHEQHIVAYCARGGYRSTFYSTAFSSIGIRVLKLEGGYKKYRKYVLDTMPDLNEKLNYIVIHGNTGMGKTEILKKLKLKGFDIIDLEQGANHRGSLLGSIGIGGCNSQKQFESNILSQMLEIKSDNVFIEAESRRIGNVMIPKYIHEKMKTGKHIFLDAGIDYRVNIIKNDYVSKENWLEESVTALRTLEKYISKEKIEDLISRLTKGKIDEVIKYLMLNYYDPLYMNKSEKYDYSVIFDNIEGSIDAADKIINWLKQTKV